MALHFERQNIKLVISGKQYLATYYEGTLDGSKFEDWYDNRDFDIKTKIVAFLDIPE